MVVYTYEQNLRAVTPDVASQISQRVRYANGTAKLHASVLCRAGPQSMATEQIKRRTWHKRLHPSTCCSDKHYGPTIANYTLGSLPMTTTYNERAGRVTKQCCARHEALQYQPTSCASRNTEGKHTTGPRRSQHHRRYGLRSADAMAMPSFHSSCDLLALVLIQRDRCLPTSRSTRFRKKKKKKTSSRIRELEAARPSPTKNKADT